MRNVEFLPVETRLEQIKGVYNNGRRDFKENSSPNALDQTVARDVFTLRFIYGLHC